MFPAVDGIGKEVLRPLVEPTRTAGEGGHVDSMFDERAPLLTVDHFVITMTISLFWCGSMSPTGFS